MNLILRPQMEGWLRFRMTSVRTGRVRQTPWFRNIILNSGLNGIGTGNMIGACHVGTGTSTPAATDTALQSFLAATGTRTVSTLSATSSEPYYRQWLSTFRFNAGAAAGNISEVGIGKTTSTSSPMYSRALVLDGEGNPTTITVLSDEILDVSYASRAYPPTTDVETTASIGGDSYDVTLRAANITSTPSTNQGPGSQVTASSMEAFAYESAIGAITGAPTGSFVSRASVVPQTYGDGTYQRQFSWTFPVDDEGDIQAVKFSTTYGDYQIGFSPAIPKTAIQTLAMTVQLAWARKTL